MYEFLKGPKDVKTKTNSNLRNDYLKNIIDN